LLLGQQGSLSSFGLIGFLAQQSPDVGSALNSLRELCGSDFKPSEVRLVHGVPEDRRTYRRLFESPVSFNSANDGLYFSSEFLNQSLKRADTELHRYLQKEVADEVRCQIACQLLNDSEIQLEELSGLLHFSDASSFIKAFKRWTGTTPARWRHSKSGHVRSCNVHFVGSGKPS